MLVRGRGYVSCGRRERWLYHFLYTNWDVEESHKIVVKMLSDMIHMAAIRAERS